MNILGLLQKILHLESEPSETELDIIAMCLLQDGDLRRQIERETEAAWDFWETLGRHIFEGLEAHEALVDVTAWLQCANMYPRLAHYEIPKAQDRES